MKKLLVIAVALASVNAYATRARVIALANAPHLVDTQTVYTNPADIFGLGDYVTLETGLTTGTTATNQAEGMVVRTMGDAKMGLSLGHQSANAATWGLRNGLPGALGINQQNPVELTYGAKSGDMNWAGTLVYSALNDKAANNLKESSMGVRLGARANQWDASLRLGLVNTVQDDVSGKYTGTMGLGAHFGYQMDTLYWTANVASNGYKFENAAGVEQAKATVTNFDVGVMTSVKKDGSEMFYGARLAQDDMKETVADSKTSSTSLPLFIGMEVDAASWLTLRGSVTQTLQLLNTDKTETAGVTTADTAPGYNDTVVAAGAGLKFNKITVDGTLQAAGGAGSQNLNGNSLLSTLGMTYNF
jgi:hypothetical protein